MEAAGTVVSVGAGVTNVAPGDRVAYATAPIGAYSTARTIAADRLVRLPDGVDFKTAAAMMLQGMTAQYLLRRTYRVKQGETVLVHAAAGGVGLILCQWAKHLGATVIGVVSTEAKAALARGPTAPITSSSATKPWPPRSSASRPAPCCRSSTTASARTRSWPAWTASPRSG